MGFLQRKKEIVLCKTETTIGSNPAPVAADALLCQDVDIQPDLEVLDRSGFHRGSLSPISTLIGMRKSSISFNTEFKWNGNKAGAAAPWETDPLWQSAGFDLTATAEAIPGQGDGYVTVTPTKDPEMPAAGVHYPTCAIWHYRDGVLIKCNACAFQPTVKFEPGKLAMIAWKGSGRYATPTDGSNVATPAYDSQAGWPVNNIALTFDTAATPHTPDACDSVEIEFGGTLAELVSVNGDNYGYHSGQHVARAYRLKCSIAAVTLATKNFFAELEEGQAMLVDFTIKGPTVAEKADKCVFDINNARLDSLKWKEVNGIFHYDLGFLLLASTTDGYDEISMKYINS